MDYFGIKTEEQKKEFENLINETDLKTWAE
jgi:hypothetical protein